MRDIPNYVEIPKNDGTIDVIGSAIPNDLTCKNFSDKRQHFYGWLGNDTFNSIYCDRLMYLEDFNMYYESPSDLIILRNSAKPWYAITEIIGGVSIYLKPGAGGNPQVQEMLRVKGNVEDLKKSDVLTSDKIIIYR